MIGLDRASEVWRVTLDRPARRNAMATEHWLALVETVARIPPEAAVVLLRSGVPDIFSAGADLGEVARLHEDAALRAPFRLALRAAVDAVAALPMPVVAAIDGGCHGAAVALALAADIRVAGPGASFGLPPARLGISYPAEDIARLSALVGPGQAARLLFTAVTIDAAEAQRTGLVEMIGDGAAVAASIAANDATALTALKAMLRNPGDPAHGHAFENSFASPRLGAATQRYR
ncbi:enoyl-CoA hydratase/isomerase family protein [Sphingomonas jeddahensis]|uniref:Putative enoyl-CoA hydratase echA6 n=1 Tax=Sphingomonas jeddahensis TaxID=1915074 RepID=A0A1V2EX88_9SPHN|nr:enoyl-CoA hydratase/isomerase family protein [Sphingomonas jeddahensis]ONF97286.1 putative enoyl-CoA hydratase echA6 [Sphingomonas jeddahensis]